MAAPTLNVQAGLGGYARRGCWAPIRVAVANVREPIDGLLELQQDEAVVTATPVTLVPGATKQYTLYLLLETVNEFSPVFNVGVRLRQERRVLASTSARLQLVDPSSRLLVTATGESTGLQALHGVALGDLGWKLPEAGREADSPVSSGGYPAPSGPVTEGVALAAHHPPATLPERWNGYQAADLVVLTGAAWAAMTSPQRQAVRRWIETGGRAILCGEQPREWADPEARRLLPGSLRSRLAARGSQLAAKAGPSQPEAGSWEPRAALLPIVPRGGAEVIWRAGDDVVACVGREGFGAVAWVGFDPFRSTVRLSPGYRGLWRTLIGRSTGIRTDSASLSDLLDVPAAMRVAGELARLPAPSRAVLAGIAIVYVLIFGPINIRMLRRLRRTVKAWLFLPSLAVLMTLVLVTMGQSWGRSRALTNRVTVTEAMADASTGWENDLVGLFSPTNLAFNLEIGEPCLTLRPEETEGEKREPGAGTITPTFPYGPPNTPGGTRPVRTSLPAALQLEDRSRWERLPLTLWSVQYQQFRHPIDLDGGISVALRERVPSQPEGWVRNKTVHRLTRAYLQYRGRRYALGTLEPGAARRVGAEGWVRRLAARGSGGDAALARGHDSGTSPDHSAVEYPGHAAPDEAIAELYEDASVLLRPGSRHNEAVLVAEAPDLRVSVVVEGVPERTSASLLLVHAPVGR